MNQEQYDRYLKDPQTHMGNDLLGQFRKKK